MKSSLKRSALFALFAQSFIPTTVVKAVVQAGDVLLRSGTFAGFNPAHRRPPKASKYRGPPMMPEVKVNTRSEFQRTVAQMTNYERNRWARAGYPGLHSDEMPKLKPFIGRIERLRAA